MKKIRKGYDSLKKKKVILLIIAAALLCTSLIVVYASINTNSSDGDKIPFSDIKETDWFCSDVQYVNEKGLMSGTSDDLFSPNDTTTRGMIVTVLWRLENKPDEKSCTFTDVADNAYYYNAVCWANKNKIVSGYDEKTFGADDYITREQLATIMYRYANYKNYDISAKISLDKYKDLQNVSEYAVSAFEWANANGIITGISEDTLSPQGNALRCQVAAIFKRFCNLYEPANDKTDIQTQNNNESAVTESSGKSHHSSGGASGTEEISNNDEIPENNFPTIVVQNVTAHPGDDVTVSVDVKNNPGILGMILTANYDESCCSLNEAVNGDIFNGILELTTSKELKSGARFVWDGIDIKDSDIKDGNVLLLKFHISDNTKPGTYPVTLSYVKNDIVDKNLNVVNLQISNGFITVE